MTLTIRNSQRLVVMSGTTDTTCSIVCVPEVSPPGKRLK